MGVGKREDSKGIGKHGKRNREPREEKESRDRMKVQVRSFTYSIGASR